jgi:hypothetical protein
VHAARIFGRRNPVLQEHRAMRNKKTCRTVTAVTESAATAALEAVGAAFEKLGGASRLADWASESAENEFAFWTQIYPRWLAYASKMPQTQPIIIQVTPKEKRF